MIRKPIDIFTTLSTRTLYEQATLRKVLGKISLLMHLVAWIESNIWLLQDKKTSKHKKVKMENMGYCKLLDASTRN